MCEYGGFETTVGSTPCVGEWTDWRDVVGCCCAASWVPMSSAQSVPDVTNCSFAQLVSSGNRGVHATGCQEFGRVAIG